MALKIFSSNYLFWLLIVTVFSIENIYSQKDCVDRIYERIVFSKEELLSKSTPHIYFGEQVRVVEGFEQEEEWIYRTVVLPDSLPDGKWILLFTSQKIFAEVEYVEGRKNGFEKFYWDNGKFKKVTFYTNGIITGVQMAFFKSGKLERFRNYNAQGESNGPVFYFDCYGNIEINEDE
jgi:antitoxin component YwqK of YwqJK toxin-antitoxin module